MRRKSRRVPELLRLEDRLVLSVVVSVDAAANRHAINPDIYGVAFGSTAQVKDLGATLNRDGGNLTSTYNWQADAANHASDYFYESLPETPGPKGNSVDSFIAASKAGGADPVVTIPTMDWVAKLGPNQGKLASFSVKKYGAQQETDQYLPDAGNGILTNGSFVDGNNPSDAYTPNSPALQKAWVQHLVSTFGKAGQGGVNWYDLDNEPGLWQETHRDIHPDGATLEELLNRIITYASAIKSVDPNAKTLGPEEWGWLSFLYSGADFQYAEAHGYNGVYPDRQAHGDMDQLPWLLDQLHKYDLAHGTHLLDVLTVHWYPQSGEYSDNVSTSMQLLRNRSTRSLWDPNYTDESYIDAKVDLIPRLQGWVKQYDPGLQIGITEYSWGAENHMNGATAQADALGIFGREALDRANYWTTPATNSPVYDAFKMYRDYDGKHSTFGNTSVKATAPNPDQVSAFAAVRSSDGALTIMVDNKNLYDSKHPTATTSITLNVGHFAAASAQRWQLAAITPSNQTKASIKLLANITLTGTTFTVNVPMQSVTLFVLKPAGPALTAKLSSGVLTIDGYDLANTVTLRLQSGSPTHLQVLNGSSVVGTFANASVKSIKVALGGGNDRFTISAAAGNPIPAGGLTLDGGAGTDILAGPASTNAWLVSGSASGHLNKTLAFTHIESLVGGTAKDTFTIAPKGQLAGTLDGGAGTDILVGPAVASTWLLSGSASGHLNKALAFTHIESLTGGKLEDTFTIAAKGRLAGSLNGGAGRNGLDYSAWTTAVSVNLSTGKATGISGTVSHVLDVFGGKAADHLSGNSLANVLVGNAGNDTISGGNGRDLLIGGIGADTASGGSGDDILIAGRTRYDANRTALDALMLEWARTDLTGTTAQQYAKRIAHLNGKTSGGKNGTNRLTRGSSATVLDDGTAADRLTGGTNLDWFFASKKDRVTDRNSGGTEQSAALP